MSYKPPVPSAETINKPLVLAIAGGLFLIMVVIFNFTLAENPEPAKESNTPNYRAGNASFLDQQPDSVEFSILPESIPEPAPERERYIPPPPDELFSGSGYKVEEGLTEASRSRTAASDQSVRNDDEWKAYQDSRQASGLIYDARNHQGSAGQAQYYSGQQQRVETNSRQQEIDGNFTTPKTPYTLLEGHLIPATLETNIESDLPGDIRGFITRDIYDSITLDHLLIPAGTRIVGSYDERVVLNQEKLLMSWDRMIFPDGRSIYLPDLSSYDLEGSSGLSGEVDRHFWRIFGQSAFLSMIGAGTAAALPEQSGFHQQQDLASIAGRQIANDFNRVSQSVLQRNMQMAPTISISGGTQFQIFLAADISFAEPYQYKAP